MGWILLEEGDTVYYPHPLRMQKNDKPMTVIDRYFAYYKKSGKKYVRYLYDGLLEAMVQEMHENVENDFDNVVCIWGREGSGKSVLGYWVLKAFDPDFDMEKCYVASYDELLKKIYESDAKEGAVFWLDEATNIASNRDWMNADNKQFIKILEIFRSRKWTLILCIPDINRLDKYLREQRIRYTLHAQILDWEGDSHKKRGYAELKRVDVQANNYRCEQTVGFLRFPDIPADDKERYQRIKKDTQDDILQEMYEKKNRSGRDTAGGKALRKLILEKRESGMSVKQIAEETGLAEQTVMNYCRQARRERGDQDESRLSGILFDIRCDSLYIRRAGSLFRLPIRNNGLENGVRQGDDDCWCIERYNVVASHLQPSQKVKKSQGGTR